MEGDCAPVVVGELEGVISIHTLRMEGDVAVGVGLAADLISIHTLRMEGDLWLPSAPSPLTTYFNPHPPHGG